jgi:hypothetical protein
MHDRLAAALSEAGVTAPGGRGHLLAHACGVHGDRGPQHARARARTAEGGMQVGTIEEMARERVPLIVIQRQLGHTNLGITSISLQGIDSAEIIDTVHARRPPVVPVNRSLRP